MKHSIKENIRSVYQNHAAEFDKAIGRLSLYDHCYDYLLDWIQAGSAILDLACGPGNVSCYLKNRKPDLVITGVDISEAMIAIARDRIKDGTFLVKDICEVEFYAEFDCVVCAFAFPYLDLRDTDRVAGIISRSVRENGIFYISFMNGDKEGFEKTSFSGADPLYVHYHPKNLILEILECRGLIVHKEFEIDYPEMDGSKTKEIVLIGRRRSGSE